VFADAPQLARELFIYDNESRCRGKILLKTTHVWLGYVFAVPQGSTRGLHPDRRGGRVCQPMQALMIWIAAMKGSVSNIVQASEKPNCAPACE
jgi:hypothetical protein